MSENSKTGMEQSNADSRESTAFGMTRRTKVTILIAVIIVIVAGGYLLDRYWIAPVAAHQALPGNDPAAPAFSLTDIFGQKLSLDQYRGKVVLLDFWATWCGPCRSEIPGFVQLQNTYARQGFRIIGISEDDGGVKPVIDFYKQFRLNYPVAIDNDGKVGELYGGIIGLPTTFLIGRDGHIYEKVPGAVGAEFFEPGIQTLLAASPQTEVKNFEAPAESEAAQVETPAEVNSPVTGIDVTKLSKSALAKYENQLSKEKCQCGCGMSVLQCRRVDPACGTSRQQAQEAMQEPSKAKPAI
ncbi:MAG: TlpA disulfide reductase family protein [Terriglobia bacterium]